MEYYTLNENSWETLSETGNTNRFSQEYEFLKHYAEKLSLDGSLGESRYVLLREGYHQMAFHTFSEMDNKRALAQGLRTFDGTKTSEILNEFGLDA